MIYTQESELINIFIMSLSYKDNLIEMKKYMNMRFVAMEHPFICSSIQVSITDIDQIQYDYYFENTDGNYEDISGVFIQ